MRSSAAYVVYKIQGRASLKSHFLIMTAWAGVIADSETVLHEDFERGLGSDWQKTVLTGSTKAGGAEVLSDADGNHFLRLSSADNFYAIGLRRHIDAGHGLRLSWRWRVHQLPVHSDIALKNGDDAAARIYLVFSHRTLRHPLGTQALVYVWDNSHPVGTLLPNPYAPEHEKVIVAHSGPAQPKWVRGEADVARDYAKAFGERPGLVTAVILAGDSDNTHSSTVADFDDLNIETGPAQKK
jgi:hypothetical protein